MWDVNWLAVFWIGSIILTLVLGGPTACFPQGAPKLLESLYRFGKTNDFLTSKASSVFSDVVERTQVPKRWFSHFYIIGSLYYTFLAVTAFIGYFILNAPAWFAAYLDCIAGSERTSTEEPVAVIVVQVLILCQVVRRAYECLFISVYSPGRMSVLHYFAGIAYYYAIGSSVMALAPGFTKEGFQRKEIFENMNWKWYQLAGAVLYFWAAAHQYRCGTILANLRKNKLGQVVSSQHKIPEGDWFCYVSCPHFLAEILLYTGINVVLKFSNYLMVLMLVFTILNQCFTALLNHQWYLDKFKGDYPQNRKAIFPFIL